MEKYLAQSYKPSLGSCCHTYISVVDMKEFEHVFIDGGSLGEISQTSRMVADDIPGSKTISAPRL